MEKKLNNGLRVKVWKFDKAGGYEVQRVEHFSPKLTLVLSGGEPFECAYKEAEALAITIDAEFVLKEGIVEEIKRESLSGEYYIKEEK